MRLASGSGHRSRRRVVQPTERKLARHGSRLYSRNRFHIANRIVPERGRFGARGIKMPENNARQGDVVEGATVLENKRGSAPGQFLHIDDDNGNAIIMLLPGPPHELKHVFTTQAEPRLAKLVPPKAIRARFYRVAGMGESDLDALISPVYKKYENPVTTILAAAGDIQVRLRARRDRAAIFVDIRWDDGTLRAQKRSHYDDHK